MGSSEKRTSIETRENIEMNIVIKRDYFLSYPIKLHDTPLKVISASIHPVLNNWNFLVLAPDGEFYSIERRHVKIITTLEEIMK